VRPIKRGGGYFLPGVGGVLQIQKPPKIGGYRGLTESISTVSQVIDRRK
jgi:hypothetical protein